MVSEEFAVECDVWQRFLILSSSSKCRTNNVEFSNSHTIQRNHLLLLALILNCIKCPPTSQDLTRLPTLTRPCVGVAYEFVLTTPGVLRINVRLTWMFGRWEVSGRKAAVQALVQNGN